MKSRFSACRWIAPAFAAIAAVACSPKEPPKPPASVAGQQTTADWVLDFHPAFRSLSSATPKQRTRSLTLGEAATDIEKTARQFFAENAEQFKIDLGNAKMLPIVTDTKGGTHITFQQRVGNVTVRGGQASLHLTKEGTVSYIQATWAPAAASIGTMPTVDAAAALLAAKADLKTRYPTFDDSWVGGPVAPSLAIEIDHAGSMTLVFEMLLILRKVGAEYRYLVEAKTGAVIRAEDEVQNATATGKGVFAYATDARKRADDVKTFEVEPVAGSYAMQRFASETLPALEIYNARSQLALVMSTDLNRWDETGRGAGSAVDAFVTMAKVDAFFASLGRHSFDNRGTKIKVVVHVSEPDYPDYCNGQFSYATKQMEFFDGDSRTVGKTAGCMSTAGTLDFSAHEYTHGVIDADLGLGGSFEAGALNESLADVFAAFVERSFAPDDERNFQFADDGSTGPNNTPIRDMRNPKNGKSDGARSPDHILAIDHTGTKVTQKGEVKKLDESLHYLSNIPSHAFYLMTVGGTNATSGITVTDGVGWSAAQELYYDVVSTRKLDPKATFKSAAKATIAVAKSWTEGTVDFVSAKPVICAWVAVGVLSEEEAKKDYDTVCRCPVPEAGAASSKENCCPEGATDTSCCNVCDVDSCVGKSDGFHCYNAVKSAGRVCENGQIVRGEQCRSDQTCTGVDGAGNITCADEKGF